MKKKFPPSVYQKIGEIIVIFTKAVKKAQAENRKLGLPNVYCENGKIYYELSNGKITTKSVLKLI